MILNRRPETLFWVPSLAQSMSIHCWKALKTCGALRTLAGTLTVVQSPTGS